jgi:hypothetical protein
MIGLSLMHLQKVPFLLSETFKAEGGVTMSAMGTPFA